MERYKFPMFYCVLILGLFITNRLYKRPDIPSHLLGHPVISVPELLSQELADELLESIKQIGRFRTNIYDNVTVKYEHIGEAVPPNPDDGKCPHRLLVPNGDRSLCILPSRFDIVAHFIRTGGVEGLKENFQTLANRLQSFGVYNFANVESRLFHDAKFVQGAKAICPKDKQVLDPFQHNYIIQLPGQTVAQHLDAPYFEHYTRWQYPQWLLVVMEFSGLFQDTFVHQVQGVAYLHTWNSTKNGGQLVYWDTNEPTYKDVLPAPRTATFMDGSKMIHAATVYKPRRKPPHLPTSSDTILEYHPDEDQWYVTVDGKVVEKYKTNKLRITVVYRARCFESEAKKKLFKAWMAEPDKHVTPVDVILTKLKKELVARGRYSSLAELNQMTPIDLALTLVSEYVKYPVPSRAMIPFNYCALDQLDSVPDFLKYLVKLGCP